MGISLWQLLIILLIVLLLFGTKKLRSVGKDLGGAVQGFRNEMDRGDKPAAGDETEPDSLADSKDNRVIEGEVTSEHRDKV